MNGKFNSILVFVAVSTPAVAWAQSNDAVDGEVGIIAWLLVGFLSGWLASRVVKGSGQGVILDMVLGIVGAFIGGIIFRSLGSYGVTGFNLWSIFVAFIGAVVVLTIYHVITGQRSKV